MSESTGVPSTPQERVELIVDKTRQSLALAKLRRLGPERPVVVAHDLEQDRRGRATSLFIEDLTWEEVAAALKAGKTTAFIYTGGGGGPLRRSMPG